MSTVYLKKGPSIEVSQSQAEQLKFVLSGNPKPNEMVMVGSQMIRCSAIDRVSVLQEGPDANTIALSKAASEFHGNRRAFAKKTPNEKTDSFMQGSGAMMTKTLGISDTEELRNRVLAFFKENPKRSFPPSTVFYGLYQNQTISVFEKAAISIYGNCVGSDVEAVRNDEQFIKSIQPPMPTSQSLI